MGVPHGQKSRTISVHKSIAHVRDQGSAEAPMVCVCVLSHFSRVRLFATLWTVPHQAPLSMRFPRQEYWSGLTFPSLGDLSNPGIEPESPALQANALPLSHLGSSSIYHYPHFKYGVSIFDT